MNCAAPRPGALTGLGDLREACCGADCCGHCAERAAMVEWLDDCCRSAPSVGEVGATSDTGARGDADIGRDQGTGTVMPFFTEEDIASLTGGGRDAEYTLDMCGVSAAHAEVAIERMLERRRFGPPTTVLIRIDPAGPASGETLFLPVGRQLLEARRRGLVTSFAPVSVPPGGGFHVTLPGHPAKVEAREP